VLSISIVRRLYTPCQSHRIVTRKPRIKQTYSNLDDVSSNQVQVLQAPENRPQLSGRPPTGLGRAGGGRKRRVERVDVNGQVDGPISADAVDDALDDAVGADGVDLTGLDDLEAAVAVVVVVAGPTKRGADARVDVGVVGEEALLRGVVEVGAVVDGGDLGRGAAEDLGLPCEAVSM
jgi:hypothetical protein